HGGRGSRGEGGRARRGGGPASRGRGDRLAGRRKRRRGVELGAEWPRVARRVLARSGLRLSTARKEKPAAFWRGGPEPIDAEAGGKLAPPAPAHAVDPGTTPPLAPGRS